MPRLGHTKSRRGCFRCKARKVKCDEAMPCGSCKARDVVCEYPNCFIAESGNDLRLAKSAAARKSAAPYRTSSISQIDTGYLFQMALLHYYTVTVSPTFPYVNRQAGMDIFAKRVPQEALTKQYLMDTLHSFSLLHLYSHRDSQQVPVGVLQQIQAIQIPLSESTRRSIQLQDSKCPLGDSGSNLQLQLLGAHRHYLEQAAQEQRKAIATIDSENADAVCITSILLAMIALVQSVQIHDPQTTTYELPMQWIYLQKAFTVCVHTTRASLRKDSIMMALYRAAPEPDNHNLPQLTSKALLRILNFSCSNAQHKECMDDESREAYILALAYIQSINTRIISGEAWQTLGRRILAFANVVPDLFLQRLVSKAPRALVVLTHLFALCKSLNGKYWIFNGVADFHVRGIAGLVPEEWQWAMKWPLRCIEGTAGEAYPDIDS